MCKLSMCKLEDEEYIANQWTELMDKGYSYGCCRTVDEAECTYLSYIMYKNDKIIVTLTRISIGITLGTFIYHQYIRENKINDILK